jgi:alpha-D-ribose 1-methylphosphonate 5-triphosphate synthase subunit PhnG
MGLRVGLVQLKGTAQGGGGLASFFVGGATRSIVHVELHEYAEAMVEP